MLLLSYKRSGSVHLTTNVRIGLANFWSLILYINSCFTYLRVLSVWPRKCWSAIVAPLLFLQWIAFSGWRIRGKII